MADGQPGGAENPQLTVDELAPARGCLTGVLLILALVALVLLLIVTPVAGWWR